MRTTENNIYSGEVEKVQERLEEYDFEMFVPIMSHVNEMNNIMKNSKTRIFFSIIQKHLCQSKQQLKCEINLQNIF